VASKVHQIGVLNLSLTEQWIPIAGWPQTSVFIPY
jgi:hypothetical protein